MVAQIVQATPQAVSYEDYEQVRKERDFYQFKLEQAELQCSWLRDKIEEIETEQEEIIADKVTRECDHLRSKVEQLDTRLTWRKQVERVSGGTASTGHKATIIALMELLPQLGPPNADGYYCLQTCEKLAEMSGQHVGTVRDHINYISNVKENGKEPKMAVLPLFEKRLVPLPTSERGRPIEITYLKPLPLLQEPLYWDKAVQIARNQGGAGRGQGRKKSCEKCGRDLQTKNTVISTQFETYCPRCQITHIYPIETINPQKLPTDEQPPEPDGPGEGIKNQVDYLIDAGENEEITNQLDTVDSYTTLYQVDCLIPPDENAYTGGGIPAELQAVAHWLPWQYGDIPQKNGKLPKIPRDAAGRQVDYTNPENWLTYEQAAALLASQGARFAGVGYVFSQDDPFTGVDLDHCRDKETGAISQEAQDTNRLLRTYGEISPSGTGIKWIARGSVAHSGKDGDLEMYDHKRFFAITGNRLPEAEATIEYKQAQLTRLNTPIAEKHARKVAAPHCVSVPCGLPDQVVLEKCRNGKKGVWFEQLWQGDLSGYPSQSEADLALCEELAYRSDRDRAMVDRLFRQSGLYREKWERADYREWTLDRAIGRKE